MKIYTTYEKEKRNTGVQIKPVLDFFRKEISETRNFTRHLNANKNYSQKLIRSPKTSSVQLEH